MNVHGARTGRHGRRYENGGDPLQDNYPRLCGGTFFTLVVQSLRQRMQAREHYKGQSDGLTDPEVLAGLIRAAYPDYAFPGKQAMKTQTNNYKACRISSGAYLPFDDRDVIRSFDARVRRDHGAALEAMTSFVKNYLDLTGSVGRAVTLVRALAELILEDDTIDPREAFCIGENGEMTEKKAFAGLTEVCLPAFLLGIWHYVITNRQDNTAGAATYDAWCPKNGRAERKYTARMGEGALEAVRVYMPGERETQERTEDGEDVIPEDAVVITDCAGRSDGPTEQASASVVNHNPIFIRQNGDGNTVIPNYGTIVIHKR